MPAKAGISLSYYIVSIMHACMYVLCMDGWMDGLRDVSYVCMYVYIYIHVCVCIYIYIIYTNMNLNRHRYMCTHNIIFIMYIDSAV